MTEPFKPCIFITFDHNDKFVTVWWSVSSSCKRMFSINDSGEHYVSLRNLYVSTMPMKPLLNINPFVRIDPFFSSLNSFSHTERNDVEIIYQ